jgi:hypothetical protein
MRTLSLAAFGAALFMHPAIGQDLPPDVLGDLSDDGGFEIEQDSGDGAGWSRYIGGTAGVVNADGDTVSRQLSALQLDINLPASDKLKTVVSVDFVDFENSYTQELRDKEFRPGCVREFGRGRADAVVDPNFPDDHSYTEADFDREGRYERWLRCERLLNENGDGYLLAERETKVTDSFADFREAYVQWEANDYATLKIGRQNLVWGQFGFFSPVGFLLPFRGTNTSPRPSRADFAYAQDAVNLSLFPTGNSEVQLIHVPAMRLDPSVEENLKSYTRLRFCGDGEPSADCDIDDAFPDIEDYDMSALRFTYYGENLIFAVTALDGALVSFDPYRDATLARGDDGNFIYRQDNKLAYGELETVALEFSYILNLNWTLKGEYTAYESKEAVDPGRNDKEGLENAMGIAIIDVKGGKPYITNDETFFALGVEYEGEEWFGHLQLVSFDTEPASRADAVLECIEDNGIYRRNGNNARRSRCDSADNEDDNATLPIFFVGRRLGEADDGFAGFGATAVFNAYGFGFFGGWRFNESLEIGGFVGVAADVSNSGPPSDENYDSTDDGDALGQIGISYLF